MGVLQSLCFLYIQDAHGLLVIFESFPTDAILLHNVNVYNFDKTIKTTKNGPKINVGQRAWAVHKIKEKIKQIHKCVLTQK